MPPESSSTSDGRLFGRHWTDYCGFLTYCAFAGLALASGGAALLLLPLLLKELATAASFLVRRPAVRTAQGWVVRLVAFGNTFLLVSFTSAAQEFRPDWLARTDNEVVFVLGFVAWLIGTVAAIAPIIALRRSFSIVPQARELVTSGPYAWARHPIYAAYLLVVGGLLMMNLTPEFAIVVVVWFVSLLVRVHFEERVLTEAFPEYSEYRRRVAAFGPRLFPAGQTASPQRHSMS